MICRFRCGWQEKRRSVQQRIDEVQRLKRAANATAAMPAAEPGEEQPALEIPEGGGLGLGNPGSMLTKL